MDRHPSKTNRLPLSSWRFTNIVKTPTSPTSPQAIRAKMAAAQQASSANRRLAQQMANRPTVQAALKIKKVSSGVPLHWLHRDDSTIPVGPPGGPPKIVAKIKIPLQ